MVVFRQTWCCIKRWDFYNFIWIIAIILNHCYEMSTHIFLSFFKFSKWMCLQVLLCILINCWSEICLCIFIGNCNKITVFSVFSDHSMILYKTIFFSVCLLLKKKPWTHYVNCVFVGTVEFSIYYIWIPCNIWIRYLLIDVWLSKFCECCWMDHKVFCF